MNNQMTQPNQSELRDKIEEPIELLLGFLGQRDTNDNWWGHDTNVGTLEDEIEGTLDSIMKLITANYTPNSTVEALNSQIAWLDGKVEGMREGLAKVDKTINLDDLIDKFKAYCQGEGDYDELDFKSDLIDWIKCDY